MGSYDEIALSYNFHHSFELAMKHLKWFWHTPNGEQEIARLKATRLFIVQDNNADNSGMLELAVGPIRLINSNPRALFKDVLLPDAEAETAAGTFVRVIIKRLAPVGGIQTFQQIELVLNPFVLNVQVSFIKAIIAFFGGKKSPQYQQNQDTKKMSNLWKQE